jgi:hypothetical protein
MYERMNWMKWILVFLPLAYLHGVTFRMLQATKKTTNFENHLNDSESEG